MNAASSSAQQRIGFHVEVYNTNPPKRERYLPLDNRPTSIADRGLGEEKQPTGKPETPHAGL